MIAAALSWALMPGVPTVACGLEGAAAHVAEKAGAPKGTADFLRVVAWHESRCIPRAIGDDGRAVGAFQLHGLAAGGNAREPFRSALRASRGVPVLGTWVAAAYVARLRRYGARRCGAVSWEAIRRAWRKPSLACATSEEATAVNRRFQAAKRRIRRG